MGSSLPHIVEDCMGVLQLYSDGTVRRRDVSFPFSIPDDASVSFHDAVFDKKLGLSLRLYRPTSVSGSGGRLPVVFYFHGGGFCVGSRVWPNSHGCCQRLASALGAVVVAPDYRLAPEHRLPAAIHDAEAALKWLAAAAGPDNTTNQGSKIYAMGPVQAQIQKDLDVDLPNNNNNDDKHERGVEWLGETVDFKRVYVIGDSSGGSMAHQLAVKMGLGSAQFGAVRVCGFILLAPFFGGVVRTISEEGPSEAMLTLEALDRFWRLSLPEGEITRDHPFANPFGPNSPNLENVVLKPILAIAGGKELMKDRVQQYAMKLKKMGKDVEYVEFEGEEHGFLTTDPYSEISQQCLQVMKRFMLKNSK